MPERSYLAYMMASRSMRMNLMRGMLCASFALTLMVVAHAQWQLQASNTTADLRGIHNVGNGVAWASGTNGAVLRTEDGGYVWQTCAIPPDAEKLDFRGIQAFDADTAIVMSSGKGDLSRLYKTTDGCHTWKLLFKNPDKDGFWDAIDIAYGYPILDPRQAYGWLLGDPVKGQFALFRTNDGGKKWWRQENVGLKAAAESQGAFAASNSSFATLNTGDHIIGSGGTAGAKVYRETFRYFCKDSCPPDKHGRNNRWEVQRTPVGAGSEASGIFAIATTHAKVDQGQTQRVVIAVGGDYTNPDDAAATAAYSIDNGVHWTAAQTSPHGYRSSVAYDENLKTWITVGPNGTDISTDDGKNWRAVHPSAALHEAPDADRNWNAISLPYVVGPKGRIGKLDEPALK